METKRRNSQSIRSLRLIVGALLVGAAFVTAEAAGAKSGGKGGGDKGGDDDNQSYTQYLDALAKFDTDNRPQRMSWSRGSHDDTLARPSFSKNRQDHDRGCYAKFQHYDWITGTYVTAYSGGQRDCVVD